MSIIDASSKNASSLTGFLAGFRDFGYILLDCRLLLRKSALTQHTFAERKATLRHPSFFPLFRNSCEHMRIVGLLKLVGVIAIAGIFDLSPSGLAQEKAPNANPAPTSTAVQADKDGDRATFLRIKKSDKGEPESLQVAIARYTFDEGEFKGAYVDLIGAVHVGSKEYYRELNKRFKTYDAMLYELVADPSANKPNKRAERGGINPVGALQTGMKDFLDLKFQLDEVDYSPANFVHADISGEDFLEDMKQRGDSFLGLFARMMGAGLAAQNSKKGEAQQSEMLLAILAKDTMKLRRVMADQFESMDSQMAGMAHKDGKSTLLTERNTKAFQVMEKEMRSGKKKLAIFYGAGHLLDMHERLLRDYKATQTKLEWLDAWPLK